MLLQGLTLAVGEEGQRMCEWMDGFIRELLSFQDGLTSCQNCTEQHQNQDSPLVWEGKHVRTWRGPCFPLQGSAKHIYCHISTCWTSISGGKEIHSALLKTQCAQCICTWQSLVLSLSSPQLNWKVWSRVLSLNHRNSLPSLLAGKNTQIFLAKYLHLRGNIISQMSIYLLAWEGLVWGMTLWQNEDPGPLSTYLLTFNLKYFYVSP